MPTPETTVTAPRCGIANPGGTPCTQDKGHEEGHDLASYGPPETPILDERAVSEIEAQMRVKDFTYYPLMSTVDCAFRVVNQIPANTYHQCSKYARETIEGYGFCLRHAAIVRAATGKGQ